MVLDNNVDYVRLLVYDPTCVTWGQPQQVVLVKQNGSFCFKFKLLYAQNQAESITVVSLVQPACHEVKQSRFSFKKHKTIFRRGCRILNVNGQSIVNLKEQGVILTLIKQSKKYVRLLVALPDSFRPGQNNSPSPGPVLPRAPEQNPDHAVPPDQPPGQVPGLVPRGPPGPPGPSGPAPGPVPGPAPDPSFDLAPDPPRSPTDFPHQHVAHIIPKLKWDSGGTRKITLHRQSTEFGFKCSFFPQASVDGVIIYCLVTAVNDIQPVPPSDGLKVWDLIESINNQPLHNSKNREQIKKTVRHILDSNKMITLIVQSLECVSCTTKALEKGYTPRACHCQGDNSVSLSSNDTGNAGQQPIHNQVRRRPAGTEHGDDRMAGRTDAGYRSINNDGNANSITQILHGPPHVSPSLHPQEFTHGAVFSAGHSLDGDRREEIEMRYLKQGSWGHGNQRVAIHTTSLVRVEPDGGEADEETRVKVPFVESEDDAQYGSLCMASNTYPKCVMTSTDHRDPAESSSLGTLDIGTPRLLRLSSSISDHVTDTTVHALLQKALLAIGKESLPFNPKFQFVFIAKDAASSYPLIDRVFTSMGVLRGDNYCYLVHNNTLQDLPEDVARLCSGKNIVSELTLAKHLAMRLLGSIDARTILDNLEMLGNDLIPRGKHGVVPARLLAHFVSNPLLTQAQFIQLEILCPSDAERFLKCCTRSTKRFFFLDVGIRDCVANEVQRLQHTLHNIEKYCPSRKSVFLLAEKRDCDIGDVIEMALAIHERIGRRFEQQLHASENTGHSLFLLGDIDTADEQELSGALRRMLVNPLEWCAPQKYPLMAMAVRRNFNSQCSEAQVRQFIKAIGGNVDSKTLEEILVTLREDGFFFGQVLYVVFDGSHFMTETGRNVIMQICQQVVEQGGRSDVQNLVRGSFSCQGHQFNISWQQPAVMEVHTGMSKFQGFCQFFEDLLHKVLPPSLQTYQLTSVRPDPGFNLGAGLCLDQPGHRDKEDIGTPIPRSPKSTLSLRTLLGSIPTTLHNKICGALLLGDHDATYFMLAEKLGKSNYEVSILEASKKHSLHDIPASLMEEWSRRGATFQELLVALNGDWERQDMLDDIYEWCSTEHDGWTVDMDLVDWFAAWKAECPPSSTM